MSTDFLTNLLYLAQHVTEAERGMAVDLQMTVAAAIALDDATLQSETFTSVAHSSIRAAWQQTEPVHSNNLFKDPSDAPRTNTSFANLRMVVAIPVPDAGAIYLDQHIRQGVIVRDDVDRLFAFAARLAREGQTDLSREDMFNLYDNAPV